MFQVHLRRLKMTCLGRLWDGTVLSGEEEIVGLDARPTGNTTQKDAELRRLGHNKRDGVARQIFSR